MGRGWWGLRSGTTIQINNRKEANMLGHYTEGYDYQMWKIAEMRFDSGIIALDIDAPNKRFIDGNLHDVMVKQVSRLASELSEKYNLGRFWIYNTGSPGCHVIFENFAKNWLEIMCGTTLPAGWHECVGHYTKCNSTKSCRLRVGHKPGRNWDIKAWDTNPVDDKPDHVVEHEKWLSLKLEAKAT